MTYIYVNLTMSTPYAATEGDSTRRATTDGGRPSLPLGAYRFKSGSGHLFCRLRPMDYYDDEAPRW